MLVIEKKKTLRIQFARITYLYVWEEGLFELINLFLCGYFFGKI